MRVYTAVLTAILVSSAWMLGCGGGGGSTFMGGGTPPAAPTISTTATQNGVQHGAVIVTLADASPRTIIFYTVDGSTPTPASQQYLAPFLVASNLTVNAIAVSGASDAVTVSTVASQTFTLNLPPGTLVWSDEFTSSSSTPAQPNPAVWTYDTGGGGFGNNELENYCAWGSNSSPCSTASPSEYVNTYPGTDGVLYIKTQNPSANVYTSARLKTQGLFSFQYGRIEFRAMVPEAQGFWPANWLLGNNIVNVSWPACGEMDVLERATRPVIQIGMKARSTERASPARTDWALSFTFRAPRQQASSFTLMA